MITVPLRNLLLLRLKANYFPSYYWLRILGECRWLGELLAEESSVRNYTHLMQVRLLEISTCKISPAHHHQINMLVLIL
jgi:hypothetical protein